MRSEERYSKPAPVATPTIVRSELEHAALLVGLASKLVESRCRKGVRGHGGMRLANIAVGLATLAPTLEQLARALDRVGVPAVTR